MRRGDVVWVDFEPARGTAAARGVLRAGGVGGPGPDRPLAPELEAASALVADTSVLRAVENEVGPLD